jgi:hypothetical protein
MSDKPPTYLRGFPTVLHSPASAASPVSLSAPTSTLTSAPHSAPAKDPAQSPRWWQQWLKQFPLADLRMQDSHQQALANLMPLLMCGEQSAELIFHNEVERLRCDDTDNDNARKTYSSNIFRTIEWEEHSNKRNTFMPKLAAS